MSNCIRNIHEFETLFPGLLQIKSVYEKELTQLITYWHVRLFKIHLDLS